MSTSAIDGGAVTVATVDITVTIASTVTITAVAFTVIRAVKPQPSPALT